MARRVPETTDSGTTDSETVDQGALRGDPARISRLIDEIAAISDTSGEDGITRIAYTPLERRAHDLFTEKMTALGLTVRTDVVGNTIAERAGTAPGRAIGTGSHLDSVPNGGRFDGIVGVVGAIEVATLLVEQDIAHRHSLRFVVFACEEGARFGQACVGSKAAGGLWSTEQLRRMTDADGVSIATAMESVGFAPDRVAEARWERDDWAAFVELHVEQGQVLEDQQLPIGLVDLISGSTRFELIIHGRASHTGSTPMHLRADALTAAAEVILLAEQIANDPRHRGTRCTVGKVQVRPGSITTIPGEVVLTVDVRDVDSGRQRDTADEIVRRARSLCEARGVELEPRLLSDASPVVLPAWLRGISSAVCKAADLPYRVMFSGASHDSQMVSHQVPAGMIFVPSRDGLSHVPQEWTSSEEIALGVQVLTGTLLRLDEELERRGE